jgi:arsenate reductase
MKATIFHNPMCGTSRKTLDILRDSGCDVWVREYLKNPPTKDELRDLYERAGITPRVGLRAKEPLAEELGLKRPDATDDEILDAMVERRPPLPPAGRSAGDIVSPWERVPTPALSRGRRVRKSALTLPQPTAASSLSQGRGVAGIINP